MDKFDNAFEELMKLEGGYINHSNDPGRATKFGISSRSYPEVDIANLTKEGAKEIYRRDFWPWWIEGISDWSVASEVFEILVNTPPRKAVDIIQRALNYLGAGIAVDGRFGPVTLRNINSYSRRMRIPLLKAINGVQFSYYLALVESGERFDPFAVGWLRRIEIPS